MFGEIPSALFHVHKWREDVDDSCGPRIFIREQSEGRLDYDWPAQVNRRVSRGQFDLILSLGQVVPHEVIGMANYNKNILVGMADPQYPTGATILAPCMAWSASWDARIIQSVAC